MKELLEAGVHFGHQTKRWNPKMKKYIFGKRNGIYIIDLQKTLKLFKEASAFISDLATQGKRILFVGTKRQAQDAILEEANRCGMFYVNNRWLGGTLTNFATVRRSIERPKELEADRKFAEGGGTLWIGDKGKMITATSQAPRLIPESKMKDFVKPPQTIERLPQGPSPHHREWLDAIKSRAQCSCHFGYGHRVTTVGNLGNISLWTGEKLTWDPVAERIVNHPEANRFLTKEYRKPWTLPGV